jgi:hypothetical protein
MRGHMAMLQADLLEPSAAHCKQAYRQEIACVPVNTHYGVAMRSVWATDHTCTHTSRHLTLLAYHSDRYRPDDRCKQSDPSSRTLDTTRHRPHRLRHDREWYLRAQAQLHDLLLSSCHRCICHNVSLKLPAFNARDPRTQRCATARTSGRIALPQATRGRFLPFLMLVMIRLN